MKNVLVAMGMLLAACYAAGECRGLESASGACYHGGDWKLEDIEAREAWWLAHVSDAGYEGAGVLDGVLVDVRDEYPACGGALPLRGCVLGSGLIQLAGLPVCHSALAHELTHVLLARDERDADYEHTRPVWAGVQTVELLCPPLEGEWRTKTEAAVAAWGR